MKNFLGHVGAWAPRPEQVAVAGFLDDEPAVEAFQREMNRRVQKRLDALNDGFKQFKTQGYPVDCIAPEGAIYLSLRLDLIGREIGGRKLETNEDIRQLVLERAGVAVIPFQAFGLEENTGWFRLSVGAVSTEEIGESLTRLRGVLDEMN